MLLVLILILLLVGSAVVGAIYSNFTVFYRSFGETVNYNKAYYASVAALERGELVIRHREPGYEGSGGRNGDSTICMESNCSDEKMESFSYLTENTGSDMLRNIKSRATRIPTQGNGNVEPELSDSDSSNYNKMDYENAEVFLLYYDDSTGNPYDTGSIRPSSINTIEGEIRLPQKLRTSLGDEGFLDIDNNLIYKNANGVIKNDAIVDRQLRGNYISSPFTLYATQSVDGKKRLNDDSAIRESDINGTETLNFSNTSSRSPLRRNSTTAESPTIISPKENDIKSLNNLKNVLDYTDTLRLSLLNLLKTKNSLIYPYLEYYIDFDGKVVSDKYYTISAEGKINDFQVEMVVQKPTIKESILGNFTVIF